MLMELRNLSVTRRGRRILDGINLTLRAGELVGLIGPNGAGKSTLMEAALGLVAFAGTSSLADMDANMRARSVAYLPQAREIAWPVSVEDLIALGRLPWPGNGKNSDDRRAIDAAIDRTGLEQFRKRTALRLSGGEQARVLLARTLAQETPLLIADEPVAGLDPAQQLASMRLFHRLTREGRGILTSIHDLGLAARFCDRLVLLSDGHVLADGTAEEVLRDDLLLTGFGIRVQRVETDEGPMIWPV